MAESTHVLEALKRAANYSKLAFHKDGPKSYKKGQGALTKVLLKFSQDGSLDRDTLEKALGWNADEVNDVVLKAQDNGYVLADVVDGVVVKATITDKGREVDQKRFEAEDRVADEILQGLSEDEKGELEDLCVKICMQCEAMGVKYDRIRKKPEAPCKAKKSKDKKEAKAAKAKAKGDKKAAKGSKKADKKKKSGKGKKS